MAAQDLRPYNKSKKILEKIAKMRFRIQIRTLKKPTALFSFSNSLCACTSTAWSCLLKSCASTVDSAENLLKVPVLWIRNFYYRYGSNFSMSFGSRSGYNLQKISGSGPGSGPGSYLFPQERLKKVPKITFLNILFKDH
jgi:hypothetical protein